MDSQDFYRALQARMGYALSKEQRQVIEARAKRIQVLATAGSGKTTTLTAKIGYTIAVEGVSAKRILALSYSKASALDFRRRFLSLFDGKAVSEVHFSTLHAFAYKIVKQYYQGLKKDIKLVDSPESGYHKHQHIARVYFEVTGQYATKEILEDLFSEMSYLKNALLDIEVYRPKSIGFIPCYKAYEAHKEGNGLIDFDDMLSIANAIMVEKPLILNQLQERFSHIYIDEAQDINPIQIQLLEKLCNKASQWIVIGDDDQSIYGFRAADPSFLINFANADHHGPVTQVQLGINYRCPTSIVEVANQHIKQNQWRLDKSIEGVKQIDQPIIAHAYLDMKSQALAIKSSVETLCHSGVPLDHIAVMVRNHYSLVAIYYALMPLDLPIAIKEDQLGFFSHWVVRDTQLYLEAMYNGFKVDTFLQLLSRMRVYIRDKDQAAIRKSTHAEMAFSIVLKSCSDKDYNRVNALKRAYKQGDAWTLTDHLNHFYNALGFRERMIERANRGGYASRLLLSIWETFYWICEDLTSLEMLNHRIKSLYDHLSKKNQSTKAKATKSLSLMTIHASKGLEFEHVLMGDLEKNILPTQEAYKDNKVMEEERRLFYVGLTRAKNRMYLFYSKTNPSPFLPAQYKKTSK